MSHEHATPQRASKSNLDLTQALRETVRGLTPAWRGAWGAMGVCLVLAAVIIFMPDNNWTWLVALAAVAAGLALKGGLLRIALDEPTGLGPAGLQLGRPEARLLGAALLCLLLIAMIVAVLGLVLLAVAGMAELDADAIAQRNWAAAGEGWKLAVVTLAGLATVFVVLSLFVRLSLYAPATVARGRMVSLDSFIIVRGSGWPLFAGLLVTFAPVIILAFVASGGMLAGKVGALVWAVVMAGLQAPLTTGFVSAAYRRLDRGLDRG